MANTVYSNEVLQSVFADKLNTKLNTRSLMKADNNLAATEGMIVKINKYTYTGEVEQLAAGTGSTAAKRGSVAVASTTHTALLYQQAFDYTDEDFMTDNNVIEAGVNGGAQVMVSDMNTKFFTELGKATLSQTYAKGGAISYDTVVDAIQKMNLEDESGLFLLIGTDLKAALRKDDDFKSARMGEIVFNGQIGTICGIPVVVSKLVPAKNAYVATPEAVTCFTKKENEVEQDRDADKRTNSVYMRTVAIVALTDATKVVKITEAAV